MASFWALFSGCVVMTVSFFIPGGAAQAGWTSYSPLASVIPTDGQTYWLIGMVLLITSSLLGAVNFIVTIIQLRAPGMTWFRMPFWGGCFLLLLLTPKAGFRAEDLLLRVAAVKNGSQAVLEIV